jgi:cell division protein FtsI (penicillin-binding protein 3)
MGERTDGAPDAVPISRWRSGLVHGALLLVAAALVARSAQVQLLEHAEWTRLAERQHVRDVAVVPPRGTLLDATGSVLVETREQMKLAIAPQELRTVRLKGPEGRKREVDARAALRKGLRELGVPAEWIRRAVDPKRKWVELPQRFLPADLERFNGLPGIRRERIMRRVNSSPEGLRGMMGALDADGEPVSGLELELDPFLRGERGRAPVVIEGGGYRIPSPELRAVEARPGHTVVLTINQALQEIAEQQLQLARERTGASGGDVVILDPRSGELLALVGVRDGRPALTSTPLAEAYEPGSVVKPFLVTRLLDLGRARVDETINTENGQWQLAGRTLRDEHEAPSMSVRDVIRLSSNIGTAKLAARMSPQEEFETLRDFGFGSFTGVPYPAESKGRLKRPATWGPMTRTSMAIGYELMATPVQIAAAYAAIANGGDLLQPVLVREVRAPDGTVRYRHQRRVVRRVISPQAAAAMRTMLESVVDSGTARAADLATFDVAGKSGTARRSESGQGYVEGRYNASFAGMFPASDPQYVIVARLIDPSGPSYFGGTVSGGMVNGILQAALATREASLDRGKLAQVVKRLTPGPDSAAPASRVASRPSEGPDSTAPRASAPPPAEPLSAPARVVVELPMAVGSEGATPRSPEELRPVPPVEGLDIRQAVRVLHLAGFQVALATGSTLRTTPASGTVVRTGSTVRLERPR